MGVVGTWIMIKQIFIREGKTFVWRGIKYTNG